MKTTALVTGATGFIGSRLVGALQERGINVRILIRPESDSSRAAGLKAEVVRCRYNDPATLRNALAGVDMVFHLAGVTKALNAAGYRDGNVKPTENLLREAYRENPGLQRFVYVSSQAAAGPAPAAEPGVREDELPRPVSIYGKSKLEAEEVCRAWMDRLPVTIVRPPAVYGPGDRDVLQFFSMLQNHLMLAAGDGRTQRFSMIYVDDLVEGIIRAAMEPKARGEVYFLTSPRGYSWDEVASAAQRELGVGFFLKLPLPKPLVRGLGSIMGRVGELRGAPQLLNRDKASEMVQDFWVCSPGKAQRELDFTASTSLETGLKKTIAWYRKEGWLRK